MTTINVDVAATGTQNGPFEPQQSFVQRLLNFQIALDSNPATAQPSMFDTTTGSNTVLLSGFRASVRISNSGAISGGTAEILIWGLPQDLMNQLATLGLGFNMVQKNEVTVYAGQSNTFTAGLPAVPGSVTNPDAQSLTGFSPVFSGTIYYAVPDYNLAPDVPMRLMASSPGINAIVPAVAASFPGSTDVATAMAGFAKLMNVGFENNNINIKLPASYYPGTVAQQVDKLKRDAHINAAVVASTGGGAPSSLPSAGATAQVLAIWPIGGMRGNNSTPPLIGPTSGLIGYPTFGQNSWPNVKMIFNPRIGLGTSFVVESSIPQINNKTLVVYQLNMMLESLVPKGKWEAVALAFPTGLSAPPVPQAA